MDTKFPDIKLGLANDDFSMPYILQVLVRELKLHGREDFIPMICNDVLSAKSYEEGIQKLNKWVIL